MENCKGCSRTDCFAWNKERPNGCNALVILYEIDDQCVFYKKKGTEYDKLNELFEARRREANE